jgi:hypothetical protein
MGAVIGDNDVQLVRCPRYVRDKECRGPDRLAPAVTS